LILLLAFLSAQWPSGPEAVEEDVTLPAEYTWDEVLSGLQADPVDLNSASESDLLRIPFVTPGIARDIVAWRQANGPLHDVYDLTQIAEIDSTFVMGIRPYVKVTRQGRESAGTALFRASSRQGGPESGPPREFSSSALTERFRFELNGLSFAFSAAKDVGESDILDFLAGGIGYRQRNTRLSVGDYELNFGQGLVFDRPRPYWLTSSIQRSPAALGLTLPWTQAENTLLRGLAVAQAFGPFSVEGFCSRSQLDATLNPDSSIHNINYEGLHDDSTAQANKDRLREDLAGARVGAKSRNLQLGLAGYINRYDPMIESDRGGFQGRSLSVAAAELDWRVLPYTLGAEVACSWRHGWAGGLDLAGDWGKFRTRLNLGYRQKDFFSPHSRSRSLQRLHDELEGAFRTSYELGIWDLSLYATTSRDFVLDSMPARIELDIGNRRSALRYGLRWKQSYKDQTTQTAGTRLDLGYRFNSHFSLDCRFEDRFLMQQPGQRGTILILGGEFQRSGFSLESRVSGFRVNDPRCRVYAYEPGFPGNNTSFAQNGWRGYAKGGVRIVRSLELKLKIGVFRDTVATVDGGLSLEARL
jgi:hypothetical protein